MRKIDIPLALVFSGLILLFIVFSACNETFFNWMFEHHQNILSWYIRPIFLIPFCFFAYKHSWSGIAITIFCLVTSMFWFPKPETVNEKTLAFLQFEMDWLNRSWDYKKILLVLSVPFSFTLLGLAFWKRSLWMGLAVIILMATGKIIWSIYNAGESGIAIIIPALSGLLICSLLIYFGFKRLEKKDKKNN
ncbi:MAG: hypothetical protein A2275_06380 [Bacteroidetes bacterium RIFOXYA12_FULL_35_11]|nr:MAG: hypothetical protein A2X01_12080 [Bacteroidetes bacterium GWF2_35_48]OFY82987.1 MAG: hypothetical protein A2275_06380 [Bacteroidetes bacterium RIFOXYA12_FULL_35_11]OFY96130.1 MAG: hypothetical protein A2309_13070 [Bacteroidetes bacterium RIFOXYB2_FULL_35_7]OFZ00744.1 MAG: hypothetical protein A2491_07910 [Bacteroidetes bacterium RIFOXYC12_FULL_35_7]